MKNKIIVLIGILHFTILPTLSAQGDIDFLRSTGKIYSVVVVIAIIFIGIMIFLFRLDNKLTKLEKQIKNEQ
ncbi:MAG: CcmD family protein [Saprospiraceae bacterium]